MDQHSHDPDEPSTSQVFIAKDTDVSTLSYQPPIQQSAQPNGYVVANKLSDQVGHNEVPSHKQKKRYVSRLVSILSVRIGRAVSNHDHSLCILIVFVSLCIASLFFLQRLDDKNSGFFVSSSSKVNQFGWKYGPTPVFVIFLAVWRQIDHHIKTRAPWKQMASGFAPAEKSVLLDYVSPVLPVAFVEAIRNRHWEVVASMAVFAFLKLAVFGSTALLNLEPTLIANQASIIDLVIHENPSSSMTDRIANHEIAGRSYLAVLQGHLPWPNGTTANAAFQQMSTNNSLPPQSSATANVLAAYPWLECEPANASLRVQILSHMADPSTPATEYGLLWATQHTNGLLALPQGYFCQAYNKSATCPENQITYQFGYTRWSSSQENGDFSSDADTMLLVTFSLATRTSPDFKPVDVNDLHGTKINMDEWRGYGWSQYLDWSSMLACKSNYAVETGRLTSSWSTPDRAWLDSHLSSNLTHTNRLMPNYSPGNLLYDVVEAASASYESVEPNLETLDPMHGYAYWFNLMLYVANATNLVAFKDPLAMIEPANTIFKGFASVWMSTWIAFPDHSSTVASYNYHTDKLRVSYSAFRLMQSSLVSALVLLVLLLVSSRKFRSHDFPDTPLQDALALKRNKDISAIFSELDSFSDNEISKNLASTSFGVDLGQRPYFSFNFNPKLGLLDTRPQPSVKTSRLTWNTWSSKPWYTVMLVLLSVCTIIVLEIVQMFSDHPPQGIPLNLSRNSAQDVTSFTTSLIMLTISTLFDSADFTASAVSPYLLLWRQTTPLHYVRTSPLRQLPPVSIVRRLRAGQWRVASIMIAAFFGSILTIIGSGLFIIIDDKESYPISVKSVDAFNLNASLPSNSSGAVIFSYLQNNNASYVDGTHDEFAFTKFSIVNLDSHITAGLHSKQSTVVVEMPVFRASLNCSQTPKSDLKFIGVSSESYSPAPNMIASLPAYLNVTSTGKLPEHCRLVSPVYGNSESYRITSKVDVMTILADRVTTYGAEMEDVRGAVRDNTIQLSSDDIQYPTHYPPGCPSAAFTIGSYSKNSSVDSTVTRMVCSQHWEKVPASLTFSLPGLKLNTSFPPVLHEDRATIISRLGWNLTNLFAYKKPIWSLDQDLSYEVDSFYHSVVHGIDGTPFDELIGDRNYERFYNATQHTYRQYMAQVIGNDMRFTDHASLANSSTSPIGSIFTATITDATRVRVIQCRTTKLILEAVLAAMIVFLLAGVQDLIACGKILTHSPFHICGRMSFLAGSKLVDQHCLVDESASDTEDRLMRQYDTRIKLRLRWWQLEAESGMMSTSPQTKRKPVTSPPATKFQVKRNPVTGSMSPSYQLAPQTDNQNCQIHHDIENNSISPEPGLQNSKSPQGRSRFGIDVVE